VTRDSGLGTRDSGLVDSIEGAGTVTGRVWRRHLWLVIGAGEEEEEEAHRRETYRSDGLRLNVLGSTAVTRSPIQLPSPSPRSARRFRRRCPWRPDLQPPAHSNLRRRGAGPSSLLAAAAAGREGRDLESRERKPPRELPSARRCVSLFPDRLELHRLTTISGPVARAIFSFSLLISPDFLAQLSSASPPARSYSTST
jgi:hypothetical protein